MITLILFPIKSLEEAAIDYGIEDALFKATIENNLSQLYYYRSARIAPGLDDKCISSWNNLQLKALADSALYFNDTALLDEAIELEKSIEKEFFKFLHSSRSYQLVQRWLQIQPR